jgi:iron complex transport system substrate-binding protein
VGLAVINPSKPDPGFPYWENLSWENADKYQPELILWDGRSYTPEANAEWDKKQPIWFSIRDAKAGAVVSGPAYWLHTYGYFATPTASARCGSRRSSAALSARVLPCAAV